MVQPLKKKGGMNIKAKNYVKKWIQLLKAIKPSERGMNIKAIEIYKRR